LGETFGFFKYIRGGIIHENIHMVEIIQTIFCQFLNI
jgi:hypothetical protein